jgi:hypothetical protein
MDLFLLQPWFVSHEPHFLNRFVDTTRGGVSLEERFVKTRTAAENSSCSEAQRIFGTLLLINFFMA